MTRGTTSQGLRNCKVHTQCRRCGKKTYHIQNKRCGACGYPQSKLRRYDGWAPKTRARKGQGTGRMRYLKSVGRRAKNNFREENVYSKASLSKKNLKTRPANLTKSKLPRRKLL